MDRLSYTNLIDFENSIRLEATPIQEFLKLNKTSSPTYVVGSKISDYLPTLRSLGFNDMWQVITKDKINYKKHFDNIHEKIDNGTRSMYAYIDYVLQKKDAKLVVFLPNKSWILAEGDRLDVPYPTYDEITRILAHFPEHSEKIQFVTGLFAYSPKEFGKKYAPQREPALTQQI